jgi:hypothetical protein
LSVRLRPSAPEGISGMMRFMESVHQKRHPKLIPKIAIHSILVIAMIIAVGSRGKHWDMPASMPVYAGQEKIGVDKSTFVCAAFKGGLRRSGLVFDLRVFLSRDQNDYLVFDTSPNGNALSVQINEQRQFVMYFGTNDAGIEISMPSPEFAKELSQQTPNREDDPVFDNLNTTVFFTYLPSTEAVVIEAYTSTPFLSTVVKLVPVSKITNVACSEMRSLGTGITGSKVEIDIGLTGRTSKASSLHPVHVKRGVASLLTLVWLICLWLTREEKNSKSSNKAENVLT